MDRLLKFFGRSGSERFLAFLPSPSWLRFRVALWLLPFKALRWIFFKLARAYGPRTDEDHFPSETGVWALEAASRYVPRATCLTQAMAGQLLFGFNEIPAKALQTPADLVERFWEQTGVTGRHSGVRVPALVRLLAKPGPAVQLRESGNGSSGFVEWCDGEARRKPHRSVHSASSPAVQPSPHTRDREKNPARNV